MTRRMFRIVVVAVLAVFVAAAACAQGLYWESTLNGGPGGGTQSKSYYMPKKFKTTTGTEGNYTILRLDADKMITVEPANKTYWEMTFAEMEAKIKSATPKMDAKKEEMRKKLAELPEDQRKMMEERLGALMGMDSKDAKYEAKGPGESKSISGYSCVKYLVTRDGKDFITLWTTKDVKDFNNMRDEFKTFSERMMSMNPMVGKGLGEAMKKVEGFPIQTDMQGGISVVVTKIEKRTTPDSEFAPPAGYKKVDPPNFEGK